MNRDNNRILHVLYSTVEYFGITSNDVLIIKNNNTIVILIHFKKG